MLTVLVDILNGLRCSHFFPHLFWDVFSSWSEVFSHLADFVQNLIDNQQHVEAVKFICACNITNKNQSSVDLLWELVQWAKVISESNCKKTNSIEIKVRISYSNSILFYDTFHFHAPAR